MFMACACSRHASPPYTEVSSATPTPRGHPTSTKMRVFPSPDATPGHAQVSALVVTPTRTASPTQTAPPTATNPPNCTYDAIFVRDVNLPDGSSVAAGQMLTKSWEVKNTGTCHWLGDVYPIRLQDGNPSRKVGSDALRVTAPGETAEVHTSLYCPQTNGLYEAQYRLCTVTTCFGPVFWVRVEVTGGVALQVPTPVPTEGPITGETTPASMADSWTGYTCDRCIKGNISYTTGERIYHVPGCEYYAQTVINTDYGERWFSSEAEAVAAGWRKAQNCP